MTARTIRSLFRLIFIAALMLNILGISPVAASLSRSPSPTLPHSLSPTLPHSPSPTPSHSPSPAPPPPATHTIHLQSRQFQPSAADALDAAALRHMARQASGAGRERVHVLVQLDFIPRQAAKDELAANGLTLLAYIPDYTWIAALSTARAPEAIEQPGVAWVGELRVTDKLDPAIVAERWGEWNRAPDGTVAVYVAFHRDESLDAGRTLVAAHGGRVTGEVVGVNALIVEMPEANLTALAAEDAVQWIEPAAPPLGEGNDGIRPQIGVDVVNAAPYNLNGAGIDVLVYDGGRAGTHVDFGTRLTYGDAAPITEHATHVAGTVGGSGANSAAKGGSALQWRGMAPGVDLISYGYEWDGTGMLFYDNPGDIEHDWAQAQNWYGADLGTASLTSNIYKNYWSTWCDRMGNYGMTSILVDQMARGGNSVVGIGDKYISLWCNGNERGSIHSCGTYSTISPPAGAKNPIHVGASNTNDNSMTDFSSWGPTDDGRIKPTIVAGGCQSTGDGGIKSTDNDPANDYTVMCGCSMATPAVAGAVALMLQHYRAVYNTSGNFWPSTAKAILIHTADDFGNPGPDYQWGYGQVNIQAAVDLISRKAFRQENIVQDEVDVYSFIVPNNASDARVTLVWDDFEATFNANPTLINNLDLELVSPSGTVWRPWVLNPAQPANNATRGVDNVNNQEQVQVPTPEVGTWLVRVRGTTVPHGPQDYTLVCEGCKPVNLGVCQSKVTGGAMMASAQAAADMSVEGAFTPLTPEPPSEGELWQRALEAGRVADDAAQTARQAEVQAALDALEAARAAGPEAVSVLGESLSPVALDLIIDEIAAAREQLTEPPPPAGRPVSEAEELAILQAQDAVEAANRALALTDFRDPAEGGTPDIAQEQAAPLRPAGPSADLTVGNGCTYATIAAAIAAASPGDTLLLEGGRTFTENVTIPITLTVRGGYSGCASGSPARTTINGNAAGTTVIVNRAIAVSLLNLNITNGATSFEGGGIRFAWGGGTGTLNLTNIFIYGNTGQWGGGLWVGPNAVVNGENVEIYNNTATSFGGGVRLYGGRANFVNSSIHDNTAPLGGGLYATRESGAAPVADLTASDVYYNQATSGDGLGGGVYLREGTLSMTGDSDLIGNNAVHGGGAYLVTSTLTLDGVGSWIYNNTATGNGGGVYAQGSTVNLTNDAQLYNNSAQTGGGAYLDASSLYGRKAAIRYNTANLRGGGVYATNGSLFDMNLGSYTCLGVRCSRLSNNTATTFYGGGVYAANSVVNLRNTFIENNTADYGGGVYAYSNATVYVYNSLFARNNAVGGTGDAVRLNNNAALTGAGNTLAYNDASGASTGQAIGLATSSLTLRCSIIWGHTSSIDTAGQSVTYSDIQGGYAGVGNLNVNPQFVAPGSSDYHLQSSSPVIDRCAFFSGMDTDFENEIRPIVRTTAATPYDMGADEVSGVARVGVNGACTYGTIQQAVNAAQDGDTVRIAAGVYFETVDIANKNITLEGGYNSTCTSYITGTTRIEGSATGGSVFDVSNSVLTVRNLDIAWGNGVGGGVDALSNARVTLDNVDVFNNSASYAAGIYVSSSSIVTLTNGARLYNNNATTSEGGGARVWGQFFAYGEDSDIYNNCASSGGGFYVPGGRLTIEQADVLSNQAAAEDGKGGGVYVTSGGRVSLRDNVWVGTGLFMPNQTAYDGAGIYADNSTVSLDGVSLGGNVATRYGGGLYLGNNSTLQATNTNLGHTVRFLWFLLQWGNQANYGGGLYADNSTVNFGGAIATNVANYGGGGVFANNSVLNFTNTTVGLAGDAVGNQLGTAGNTGAGLYLTGGTNVVLSNTVIVSNTFQTTGYTYGGGIYATDSSMVTLQNSRIEQHYAPSASDGRGAGMYLNNSAATLDNSQIISNTAGTLGGGVRMFGVSTLNVLNGSLIANNRSDSGEGGAIAASGTPDINISDATVRNNTAGTHGGAIYINAGTLDFTDGWTLRENTAQGGNGGAIAATGTARVNFNAGRYSLVYFNRALGGHGGMLYLGNNTTSQVYAINGYNMYIYANYASGNGGAIYADAGGYFDIYGQVVLDRNRADNGGAIYLGNGSRVWLDDYANIKPQLWDNWADYGSGGAIYASNSPSVRCDGAIFGQENDGNHASVSGGALYLSGSTFSAENCLFMDNEAAINGGAIAAYTSTLNIRARFTSAMRGSVEGGERIEGRAPAAPQATGCDPKAGLCSAFVGNVADSDGNNTGYGGALYSQGNHLSIQHTQFAANAAVRGGAIYQTGSDAAVQVQNTLIYSNTSTAGFGAGIRSEGGVFTVTHVTLANNVNGAGVSQANTNGYATDSIAWGNTNGGFWVTSGMLTGTCSLDQSGNAGPSTDPRFVDAANSDFHLLGDSPAIDACATGLSPDLDNVLRPAAGGYDMGAFEYPYGLAFAPNRSGVGYPAQDVTYIHTLTNTGGVNDTFTFSGNSGHGWSVALPAPLTLTPGAAASVAVTLHVPAGVLSGTVDTLLITATSQTDPNLSAVVTDTTTIGFAPGASIAPDRTTLGASVGQVIVYQHWLTNTGNAQDTFHLAFASSRGWGALLTSSPIILNAGQSAAVNVQVTVPAGGDGQSDTSVVTATSTGGAGPATVRDITSAFTPGVALAPDNAQTVSPDVVLTYTHRLTNTGTSTDTYTLLAHSTAGWGSLLDPGPFTLAAGAAQSVRVRVVVPPGSAGMGDMTTITATSGGGGGSAAVHDATSVFAAGLAFAPDYAQGVPAGQSVTYTHRLTNTGGGPDTFDVGVAFSSQGWGNLLDGGPFTLNPGEAVDVRLRVETPAGSGGLTDTTVITATSRAAALTGLTAAVTDTTTALRVYGAALGPDYARSLAPGDAVTYTHRLTNTGNGTDIFHLAFSSSAGWGSLLDSGPFTLTAGASVGVRVHVETPAGSGGLADVSQIVATSALSPAVSARAAATTTAIYTPGVALEPDYVRVAAAGDSFTHTHYLTNTGTGADWFGINFSSSQGWATLLDTGPFYLTAGESVTVHVRVDAPIGGGGRVDTAILTATAQAGGVSDTATDVTSILFTPGVELTPDYTKSVAPGTTHIHLHTLRNAGNGADTFNVTLVSSSNGWSTLLDSGPFTLGAGETTNVRVSVSVPTGLISGTARDVTVIRATSAVSPAVSDTATDTTTVGFAPGIAFAPDRLTTGATAGSSYNYTHTLTNLGNYTDTFTLTYTSSAGWATLLTPGPFTLVADGSAVVQVQVTLPATATGLSDTTLVTATSDGGAGPLRVRDVTAAFTPGVTFTPDGSRTLNVGETFTYTHWLTNSGASTDTFTLELESSRGWATLLRTGPLTLAAGEAISVQVRVAAPPAGGGLTDVTTVTAAALGGAGPQARVVDTTRVNYHPGIALSPGRATSAPAGGVVIYTHWLTNTGDGPDTFALALHSTRGWGGLLDGGPFTLAPDSSVEVRVRVAVPTDTAPFVVDVTAITATASSGGVSASAANTTTVTCEPLSGANFTFTPAPGLPGQPVTFNGSVASGSGPVVYTWNFGEGTRSGNPISHTFAAPGSYPVVMTATNSCPSVVTTTRAVLVAYTPDIAVTPAAMDVILAPDSVATQTLTIHNLGTAALMWSIAETPTRTWLAASPVSGTVAPSGQVGIAVAFDAAGLAEGVYTTTLRVDSNDPDEPQVDVGVTLTVTSACIPVASAGFNYAPAAPVIGEVITFTGLYTPSTATTPVTQTWSFGGGVVKSGATVTHSYAVSGTYAITVTVANPCTSPAVEHVGAVRVVRPTYRLYLPTVLRNF